MQQMAHLPGYGRSGGLSNSSITAKRKREEEIRRQAVSEKPEDLPTFSEPRRVTERQDSLTHSIQNVLGDMDAVNGVIGRNLYDWLGTSRRDPNARQKPLAQPNARSRDHREGTPSSRPVHGVRSKQHLLDYHQSPSGNPSHSSDAKSRHVPLQNSKLSDESSRPSSTKGSSYASHPNVNSIQGYSKRNASPFSVNATAKQPYGYDDKSSLLTSSHDQVPTRERIPSMDMPREIENIFQEVSKMGLNVEEPISAIQTPQIGQEFNFTRNEIRAKDSSSDLHDDNERNSEAALNSDSDSSDESGSEESDDEDYQKDKWLLGGMMQQLQEPQNKPIITTADENSSSRKSSTAKKNDTAKKLDSPYHRITDSSRNHRPYERNQSPYSDTAAIIASRSANNTNRAIEGKTKEVDSREPRPRGRPPSVSNRGSRSPSVHRVQKERKSNNPQVPKKYESSSRDSSRETSSKQSNFKAMQSKSSSSTLKPQEPRQRKRSPKTSHSRQPHTNNTVLTNEIKATYKAAGPERPLPFSVSNKTLPSRGSPPDVHPRTGKKGPATFLGDTSKKTPPARDLSSDSSYSDSSDEGRLRSVISPDSEDDEGHKEVETRRTGHELDFWDYNSTRDSSSNKSTSKPSVKRKSSYPSNSEINKPNAVKRRKEDVTSLQDADNFQNNQAVKPKREPYHKPGKPPEPKTSASQSASSGPARSSSKPRYPSPHTHSPKPKTNVKKFPSLWVKLPTTLLRDDAELDLLCSTKSPRNLISLPEGRSSDTLRSNTSKYGTGKLGRRPATSTGSETDKPSRMTDDVAIVPASSSDLSASHQTDKRSCHDVHARYSDSPSKSSLNSERHSKRRDYRSTPQEQQNDHLAPRINKRARKENNRWKDRREENATPQYENNFPSEQSNSRSSRESNHNIQASIYNDSRHDPVQPSAVATAVPEPDSSWPEQETHFHTSDQFMREGKRLKHEGDSCGDSRTGRTKVGEAFNRAALYFQAASCFIMNGYMLERESGNDRNIRSPSSMYQQTIDLLDYVQKMRPHDERGELVFKRLNISCLRAQALLHLRMYKLKSEVASKHHETIAEHFKSSGSRSARTPSSPWRANPNQNVISPISPAVPSPYGINVQGPSPVAGTNNPCEQVSSSTQVGKITSPPTQNGVMLPPKIYDTFKQYHTIMGSLLQAHEKWDQANSMMKDHLDFFHHVRVLGGSSLSLDSSLEELEKYNKGILRQLRHDHNPTQE